MIMLPGFMASLLCRLIVLQRGDGSVNLSLFPAGACAFCCPIELDRDIEYQLYTRSNPKRPHILKPSNPWSLRRSNFDKNVPTIVYIHGYGERAPGRSSMAIRDAYLRRGRYNVILVNWGKLSALPWYVAAVGNSRRVGPHVGRMVKWLEYQGAVPMSKLHVIGFSLGAEVAGFMGKYLAPRKVARITGLDAAYPLYMNTGSRGHLASSDATFVDVIHTDGGTFGFLRPLGHADFYPNGGRPLQPGCSLDSLISMGVTRLLNQYIVCGHNRAWRFYAESVTNSYGFPASRCRKWPPDSRSDCTWQIPAALMGIATDPRIRELHPCGEFPHCQCIRPFDFSQVRARSRRPGHDIYLSDDIFGLQTLKSMRQRAHYSLPDFSPCWEFASRKMKSQSPVPRAHLG